jgi:two-component system, OmpR family, response regulator
MQKILLIDDDEKLASPLQQYCSRFNLDMTSVAHPEKGLALLLENNFELLILDVMLPDIDGFEVCRRIRQQGNDIPIIMLTARGDVMDRVVGLELGADDYLPKPFEPRELVARIQNILKRSSRVKTEKKSEILDFGDLCLDQSLRKVTLQQQSIELTTLEYQLLLLLMLSPNKNFSRDEILNQLKGIDTEVFSRSIDILVSRLRQKLKPLNCIKTVWGVGYCFINATHEVRS